MKRESVERVIERGIGSGGNNGRGISKKVVGSHPSTEDKGLT